MPRIRLTSGVEIWDVGPALNALFDDLYAGRPLSLATLQREAWAYFDVTPNPDEFAFNFGQLSLPHPEATVRGLKFWEFVLGLMEEWEVAHPGGTLHKGGAYYFAAIRDILMGDLDRGFLYMHKAAQEDERTHGPGRTPAEAFITQDPRMQDQAFKTQVEVYSAYLQRRLASYRRFRAGTLTLPGLRGRFTRHPQLRDPLFALAYVVARLEQATGPEMGWVASSGLAAVLRSRLVLDLALIVEELLRDIYEAAALARAPHRVPTFVPLAVEYAAARHLPVDTAMPALSRSFHRAFDATMTTLLAGKVPSPITSGLPMTARDHDLAIVAGLRNHSAHGVSRSPLIASRFEDLVRHAFYVLFAVIEDCYP